MDERIARVKRPGRIPAHEKFLWRGYEFRLSRADSLEARWQFEQKRLRMVLIYRDLQDDETPPEFTALIRINGSASASGIAGDAVLALEYALRDLRKTLRDSVRILIELQHGKSADPE